MCERESLDELFETAEGEGVAIAIDILDIWCDSIEELGDFFEACIHVLLDVRREVLVEMLDSVMCEQTFTVILRLVLGTSEG